MASPREVLINGAPVSVAEDTVTAEAICALAGVDPTSTVFFQTPRPDGSSYHGALQEGRVVTLQDGMSFETYATL